MADVFISYSKARPKETVELAKELEGCGYTVWWDKELSPGESFRNVITAELAAARAAIVIWTPASVKSDWVISEASRAQKRNILIPVCSPDLKPDDIPPPFDVVHTEPVTNRAAILGALTKMGVLPSNSVPATGNGQPVLPKPPVASPWWKDRLTSRRSLLVGGGMLSFGAGLATFAFWPGGQPTRPEGARTRNLPNDGSFVTSVAYTADSRNVLSGTWDRTLRLWDVAEEKEIRRFEGHDGVVWCIVALPDGQHMISAGQDGTLKLWDLTATRAIRTFKDHGDEVWSMTVLSDGKRALSGSRDKTLKLWDISDGKVLHTIPCGSKVSSVTASRDGRIAVAAAESTLQSWTLADAQVGQSFKGHAGEVKAAVILPNGREMISGGDDASLRLWELSSGRELRQFPGHSKGVLGIAVSSDGRTMLSGSEDRTAKIWDIATGRMLRSFEEHSNSVETVALAPNGRAAVTGGRDRAIKVWDLPAERV